MIKYKERYEVLDYFRYIANPFDIENKHPLLVIYIKEIDNHQILRFEPGDIIYIHNQDNDLYEISHDKEYPRYYIHVGEFNKLKQIGYIHRLNKRERYYIYEDSWLECTAYSNDTDDNITGSITSTEIHYELKKGWVLEIFDYGSLESVLEDDKGCDWLTVDNKKLEDLITQGVLKECSNYGLPLTNCTFKFSNESFVPIEFRCGVLMDAETNNQRIDFSHNQVIMKHMEGRVFKTMGINDEDIILINPEICPINIPRDYDFNEFTVYSYDVLGIHKDELIRLLEDYVVLFDRGDLYD